jgi:hypothetical protein
MSGQDGNRSVRAVPLWDPPPILPIRIIDDLRMSESLFDERPQPVEGPRSSKSELDVLRYSESGFVLTMGTWAAQPAEPPLFLA